MSKKSVNYWRSRVFQNTYSEKGETKRARSWSVRFQMHDQRRLIPLRTRDRQRAAMRARDLYEAIARDGWSVLDPAPAMDTPVTIGRLIEGIGSTADLSAKSLKDYSGALRTIAAHAASMDHADRYHPDARWRRRVDAVELATLTPSRIQAWKKFYVDREDPDPATRRRRMTSANSYIRCARSLFARKHIRHLDFTVENPFAEIDLYPRDDPRYVSRIDAESLLGRASQELPLEELKIVVLALLAGLRKREIDLLTWPLIDFQRSYIELRPTEHLRLKSTTSAGLVPLDPETLAAMRGWGAKATGEFVVEAEPGDAGDGYRCERTFQKVYSWLRAQGIADGKPLHTLRKEFGSLICRRHGIHVASRLLRHADLTTTSRHYVDSTSGADLTTGIRFPG